MTTQKEFYEYYRTLTASELDDRLGLIDSELKPAFQNKAESVKQNLANMESALRQARSEKV